MENSQTNQLIGEPVLVHPELHNDPARRQGQIGTIASVNLERDDIFVSFGQGALALYGADALLRLKPPKDVYLQVISQAKNLSAADFKTLFQISLLLDYGNARSARSAFELAAASPAVRQLAMVSLQKSLGLGAQHENDYQSEIRFSHR
jgi:hypothetical protein